MNHQEKLVILLLSLLFHESKGKLYTPPERWTAFVNDSSIPEFQGDGRSGSYRLISAFPEGNNSSTRQQELLLSHNRNFGLAFLNFNGTGKYYLALMFGTRDSVTAAPIWIANRDVPVPRNSFLTRASTGRLELLHGSNESAAWHSGTNIVSISIPDSGNLQLRNEFNITVWSFFDHPENVLLPNQKLVTGQTLVSNRNSSDPSRSSLFLRVEPSGMVAYMSMPSKTNLQPYLLWGFTGTTLSSATGVCPGFRTAISLSPGGELDMEYEPDGDIVGKQQCGSNMRGKIFPGNTTMRYFQFGDEGIIVSYRRETTNGSWLLENLNQYFSPPVSCGSYGLFQTGKPCQCLSNIPNNSTTSLVSTSGSLCSKPEWLSLEKCSTKYETEFVTMAGTSYISNQYLPPNRTGSGLEDCLQECKSTCSCAAFFYDGARQNCFYVEDVLGSLMVDNSSTTSQLTGFLKYQNYSRLVPVGDEPKSNTAKYVAIGVLFGSAAVACTVFAVVLVILRRRKILLKEFESFLTSVEASPFQFTYRSLHSATEGFTKILGKGGAGVVYEGTLQNNNMTLAVKKLMYTDQAQKHFITEVQALGSISHINIVRLYGFCAEASNRLLVYEFMSNGSLDEWIFSTKRTSLDWKRRHNIALDTARGLAYLHEETRDQIIHLDIKPQNILLGDKLEAKVGDFGMAKLVMNKKDQSQGVVTGVRGTPGYLAPEWLIHGTATKKCDVYSYGMVLLELIGGRRNLDLSKMDDSMGWYFPAWALGEVQKGNTMQVVDESIRDSADAGEAQSLIHTALWCVQEDPVARPSMKDVVQMLESRDAVDVPPLGFHFLDVQPPGILTISSAGENSVTTFSYIQEV